MLVDPSFCDIVLVNERKENDNQKRTTCLLIFPKHQYIVQFNVC